MNGKYVKSLKSLGNCRNAVWLHKVLLFCEWNSREKDKHYNSNLMPSIPLC